MKRQWVKVAGVVGAVLILIFILMKVLISPGEFRPRIESALSAASGRQVKVGDLQFSVLSGSVAASDFSIADDPAFSQAPFLHARALHLKVDLLPLIFSHKLIVKGLTIDSPEIALIQSPSGQWNFSSLGQQTTAKDPAPSSGSGLDLAADHVRVTGGQVTVTRLHAAAKPETLDQVNLRLDNFSATSVFPFSLSAKAAGGGEITLDGKAGPLQASNTASTQLQAHLKMSGVSLASSGFVDAASGIDGIVALDSTSNWNGQNLQAEGSLKIDKLKLVRGGSPARPSIALTFAIVDDPHTHAGQISRGDIQIGAAKAGLTGSWTEQGENTVFNTVLTGAAMPVNDLTAMLPALDVALPGGSSLQGGTANVKLNITGPAAALVAAGPVGLSNMRLAGFDLGGKMAVVQELAGLKSGPVTEIQTLRANARFAPGGTSLSDIDMVVPSIGEITGAGTVSPNHALNFKMRAALHAPSGNLLTGLVSKGGVTVPFAIQGTESDPSFKPDVAGLAVSEVNQHLVNSAPGKAASGIIQGLLGKK